MEILNRAINICIFWQIKQKQRKCHEEQANALIKMCVGTFISLVRFGPHWSCLVK